MVWAFFGRRYPLGSDLAVSLLGALAAILGLAFLARGEGASREQMQRVLVYGFLASPLAFFLFAPYPAGWLVATVAGSLTFARMRTWRHHWYMASTLALFAVLLHPTGIVLWPALLVEFAGQHRWSVQRMVHFLRNWRSLRSLRRRPSATSIVTGYQLLWVIVAVPYGLGIYAVICQAIYHDPLAFLRTQSEWFGHSARWPWDSLHLLLRELLRAPTPSYGQARLLVDLVPWLFSLALLAWTIWQRHRGFLLVPTSFLVLWAFLLYLCIALPVVGTQFPDTIVSAGRYLLVAIPVPLVLSAAADRYPRVLQSLVYLGVIMQVVFCVSYLSHLWIV
jgi:hypothetical protein